MANINEKKGRRSMLDMKKLKRASDILNTDFLKDAEHDTVVFSPSIIDTQNKNLSFSDSKDAYFGNRKSLDRVMKNKVTFRTGSNYVGQWDALGMAGSGLYKMFHDVQYEGRMKDGMFHGKGIMWYPNNSRIEGIWKRGINVKRMYYYNDGLTFQDKNWAYCKYPDRRFKTEISYGIQPTGRTMASNRVPPRPIPPNCYDTGDGFYNPQTKCVTHPETDVVLRIPPKSEENWILQNCRKSDGLDVNPIKENKADCLAEFEDNLGLKLHRASETEQVDEIEEEEEEKKIVQMEDKATGRFDLLRKKVKDKPYSSKYILVDEKRARPCRKHRLYLPALKVKTKVNILPDFKVMPPKQCVHEMKAIVANKLILLLKALKECEVAGNVKLVDPNKLRALREEFQVLLTEERTLKERVLDAGVKDESLTRALFLSRHLGYNYDEAIQNVIAYKEGKTSVLELPQNQLLKIKKLASLIDEMSSTTLQLMRNIPPEEFDSSSPRTEEIKNICDTCVGIRTDAKGYLKKMDLLNEISGDEEKVIRYYERSDIGDGIIYDPDLARLGSLDEQIDELQGEFWDQFCIYDKHKTTIIDENVSNGGIVSSKDSDNGSIDLEISDSIRKVKSIGKIVLESSLTELKKSVSETKNKSIRKGNIHSSAIDLKKSASDIRRKSNIKTFISSLKGSSSDSETSDSDIKTKSTRISIIDSNLSDPEINYSDTKRKSVRKSFLDNITSPKSSDSETKQTPSTMNIIESSDPEGSDFETLRKSIMSTISSPSDYEGSAIHEVRKYVRKSIIDSHYTNSETGELNTLKKSFRASINSQNP